MPAYVNGPAAFNPAQLVQKGVPCYLWGSLNLHQGDTVMLVNNVALTSNVATLTVQITAGEIPVTGALISVRQTASTSGLFNVNRVKLTGVTITASTGAGTVTFALTHADVASAADAGSAIVEVPEVGEAVAAGASVACIFDAPHGSSQFTVTTAITFGTLPTAANIVLQRAVHNNDAEFTTIGNAAVISGTVYTTGPVAEFTLERAYFYRFLTSGLTLGSGAGIVAKIAG
jgi:hypothetical protein